MADVAANPVRRVLQGNLQPRGWRWLGSIAVQRLCDSEVFRMVALGAKVPAWGPCPYLPVLRAIKADAIPMLMPPVARLIGADRAAIPPRPRLTGARPINSRLRYRGLHAAHPAVALATGAPGRSQSSP